MSDFKFVEEDSPSLPPPTPPAPPQKPGAAEKSGDSGAKPDGSSFTEGAKSPLQKPLGPAPPVMPVPSIPSPTLATPPSAKPAPVQPLPTPPATTPANPQAPSNNAPQAQPRPAAPAAGATAGQAQAQSQAQGSARPLQPRPHPANQPASAPTPNPAPGPAPIPTPSFSIPIETVAGRAEPDEREGAPQDDFSFKIWSMGQNIKKVLDALEGPASWLLRTAIVIGITALAYLLAGTMLGHAGNLHGNPNAAALVKNLTLSSHVLMVCLLAIAVSMILLGYEDNRLGFLIGGVGLLCNFVVPIILKKSVGDSAATAAMAPFFRHYGYYLVIIGLLKGSGDLAYWIWTLPDRMKQTHARVGVADQAETKQRMVARQANMFSPCWKLPFCRESIRKQCPAFLAAKTCWKFGRGCYCDEEMISRIVRGEALDMIKAPTRQSRQGKPPCGRCYIYLEHQTYKFRVISPLALPAAVLTTWLTWPIYVKVFTVGNNAFDSIFNTLSFNSGKLTPEALETSKDSVKEIAQLGNRPEDVALIAQNMIGILLGFMLLIYISKFIEWAIFKAKW